MYATAADMVEQYDLRVVQEYASDNGIPISPAGLGTNPRVLNALRTASARIDAACQRGKRYSRATLASLAADTDRGALLQQMTCAFALAQLIGGRLAGAKITDVVYDLEDAEKTLEELRGGALTFDVEANLTASVPISLPGPTPLQNPSFPTSWNPIFGSFPPRSY